MSYTHKEYVKLLRQKHGDKIEVIELYRGITTKIKHKCSVCNYEVEVYPNNVLRHELNCMCRGFMYSHEEYIKKVEKTHGDKIEVLSKFVATRKKLRFKCNMCEHIWKTMAHLVMNGTGCPICSAIRKTHKQYLKEVKSIFEGNIKVLGTYTLNNVKVKHRCKVCGHKWSTVPIILLRHGCPECNRLKIITKHKQYLLGNKKVYIRGYEDVALDILVKKHNPNNIKVDFEGSVPKIPYKFNKTNRIFYPDIFLPKFNRIIEVKSTYTFLLREEIFRINCAKAKAVLKQGYKFSLYLIDKGERIKVPNDWYTYNHNEITTWYKEL